MIPKNFLIIIFLLCQSARADIIKISSDPWYPFTNKTNSKPGYVIELATQIFEQAGHSVEYSVLPWSRAIDLTRRNKMNILACCYKEEAEDFVFPIEEVGRSINRLYSTKPFTYSGTSSLKGLRIGVVQDYSYGAEFDSFLSKNKLKVVQAKLDPLKSNFGMLAKGRMDLVIANQAVASSVIKRLHLKNIYASKEVVGSEKKLWLCFSPNSPYSKKYAEIYSKGIREFRKLGKLQKILTKYGLEDWK